MLKELVKHLFPRLVREGDLRKTYTFCLGGWPSRRSSC